MSVRNIVFDVSVGREKRASPYQSNEVPLYVVRFEWGQVEALLIGSNPLNATLDEAFVQRRLRRTIGQWIGRGTIPVRRLQSKGRNPKVGCQSNPVDSGWGKQDRG